LSFVSLHGEKQTKTPLKCIRSGKSQSPTKWRYWLFSESSCSHHFSIDW